jgi:hypothetical protein
LNTLRLPKLAALVAACFITAPVSALYVGGFMGDYDGGGGSSSAGGGTGSGCTTGCYSAGPGYTEGYGGGYNGNVPYGTGKWVLYGGEYRWTFESVPSVACTYVASGACIFPTQWITGSVNEYITTITMPGIPSPLIINTRDIDNGVPKIPAIPVTDRTKCLAGCTLAQSLANGLLDIHAAQADARWYAASMAAGLTSAAAAQFLVKNPLVSGGVGVIAWKLVASEGERIEGMVSRAGRAVNAENYANCVKACG